MNNRQDNRAHAGFTLVEILIVIAIIGILAAVTVFAVRGVTNRGESASCVADAGTLETAVDAYFAQNTVDVLPATGAGGDRFEQTLVNAGFLQSVSTYHNLDTDGAVSTAGTPCP